MCVGGGGLLLVNQRWRNDTKFNCLSIMFSGVENFDYQLQAILL